MNDTIKFPLAALEQLCNQIDTSASNEIKRLERERDEAREENKKLREVLEWISKRYDDSKPTHAVAMDCYEMSCTARAVLQKEETK
jgi:hypothetical protein